MGENDVVAALGSLVCAVVAGNSASRSRFGWTSPLMHMNLTAHGVIGLIHYQNSLFQMDTAKIFPISLACARYLAVAGLNADIYRQKNEIASPIFLLSGAVPLYFELMGQKNEQLGTAMLLFNCAALAYYAFESRREYGWYALAAAIVGCIAAPNAGVKPLIPLGLAALDHCGFKIFLGDVAPDVRTPKR